MPFRSFTLAEVADYLHLKPAAVEDLARRGEIPCLRQGKHLSFSCADIEEWASRRLLGLSEERLADFHHRSTTKYHDLSPNVAIIPRLAKPGWIHPGMTCRSKPSVIRQMADYAEETDLLCYHEELLESLVEREKLCSTALAGGMAMLHPRVHEPYMFEDSFVVLGKTIAPIPFGSPDRSTTDVFFLICCQDDRIHLHVLARLCMMCQHTGLLTLLRDTDDPGEMYARLVEAEEQVIKQL